MFVIKTNDQSSRYCAATRNDLSERINILSGLDDEEEKEEEMKQFLTACAAAAMIFMSGCIPIRSGGTTHYLVVGIGVVSVNNTNRSQAQITKSTVLGGYASENGGGIGYSSQNRIMVVTNADMDIEVFSAPFKSMKVNVK